MSGTRVIDIQLPQLLGPAGVIVSLDAIGAHISEHLLLCNGANVLKPRRGGRSRSIGGHGDLLSDAIGGAAVNEESRLDELLASQLAGYGQEVSQWLRGQSEFDEVLVEIKIKLSIISVDERKSGQAMISLK